MRAYRDLLSDDPAWPGIAALVAEARTPTVVLPPTPDAARACLEGLQVTTRSTLGAIAHETGGMLVDHGWLRILGCGHPTFTRRIGQWNADLGVPFGQLLIVADDVVGGVFAINAGALGPARGNVFYFAPDTLRWEDTERGHSAWLHWVLAGDVALYYQDMRWPGWESEIAQLRADRALSLYPFPWTVEGQDIARVSRRSVPAAELWRFQMDMAAKLDPRS
ncbi:MAG: DUF2625 family protein [Deltaproteobacteria bacterium]|nr:DUF2625 family protein [Deltaproteobacteria bacterium]